MQATLTSKGQLTLPKAIRQQLKLKTGDKVDFQFNSRGVVQVIPLTTSVTKLKGMVPKPKKKVTLKDMQRAIEREGSKN